MVTLPALSADKSVARVSFLPEVVRDQLDEAAYAWTSRSRFLKEPDSPLYCLKNQENLLRNHLTALACAFSSKLKRRLVAMVQKPGKQTPERAFVGAFLLLRCAREDAETFLVEVWRSCTVPKHAKAVGDALVLAQVKTPTALKNLVVNWTKIPHTRHKTALKILSQAQLPAPLLRQWLTLGHSDQTVLAAVHFGLVAPNARWFAEKCLQMDLEAPSKQLENVLFHCAPKVVQKFARDRAVLGLLPTPLEILSLASNLPATGLELEHDWELLMTWLGNDRLRDNVASALLYTGRLEAVDASLKIWDAEVPRASSRKLAQRTFEMLSGIEAHAFEQPARGRSNSSAASEPEKTSPVARATSLWREKRNLSRFAMPMLHGKPRDFDTLLALDHILTVRQWGTWLKIIDSRYSLPKALQGRPFLTRQMAFLQAQRKEIDLALFFDGGKRLRSPFANALYAHLDVPSSSGSSQRQMVRR